MPPPQTATPLAVLSRFLSSPSPPPLPELLRTHALAVISGLSPCPDLAAKLVSSYAFAGLPGLAALAFSASPCPDTFLWNALIHTHRRASDFAAALAAHRRMLASGARPSRFTAPLAASAAAELSALGAPKLLAPLFFRSLSTAAASAVRKPTTAVAVLWYLATLRPPTTLPLYDAAVRLHLAATSFGRLRLSAAFVHPTHRLPAPAATTHLCRVCGRRFRARDALLRHFDAIHAREHAKRLARIDSSRGDRRVRLAAALSLKLSKYEKAARELTAGAGAAATPADELGRAGIRVALSRTPAVSLRERAQQVLDEGSVGCLMLVSGKDDFASLLRVARERGVRSVVVGRESGLARWADVGFSWADIISGKARNAGPSVSGKWRDKDVLKELEWRYEEADDNEEVMFEDSDGDDVEELACRAKGKPWWKLDSDDEDSNVGVRLPWWKGEGRRGSRQRKHGSWAHGTAHNCGVMRSRKW